METYTITLGDVGENHVGMMKVGELANSGFSVEQLYEVNDWFRTRGCHTEIVNLHAYVEENVEEAVVLIAHGGLKDADGFMEEQRVLEKDTKALMRGRVVNKRARYNLCFAREGVEPDYNNGVGRVVPFEDVPILRRTMNELPLASDLVAEGNYYYDVTKCGIGFHGDSERRKVIGLRVGASLPLHFQWYKNCERVGDRCEIELNHGDIYYMSEKAVGSDWRKRSRYTLRHAAGCEKYLK